MFQPRYLYPWRTYIFIFLCRYELFKTGGNVKSMFSCSTTRWYQMVFLWPLLLLCQFQHIVNVAITPGVPGGGLVRKQRKMTQLNFWHGSISWVSWLMRRSNDAIMPLEDNFKSKYLFLEHREGDPQNVVPSRKIKNHHIDVAFKILWSFFSNLRVFLVLCLSVCLVLYY